MWFDPVAGAVAKTHSEIRMLRPNTSLPGELSDEIIRAEGFKPLLEVAAPEYDEVTHQLTEGTPELVGGAWKQTWVLTPYPVEVVAARFAAASSSYFAEVRDLRERILNRLAGIGFAAKESADQETVEACLVARQRLLDITKLPAALAAYSARDLKGLQDAVEHEYDAIVESAPTELINAFDKVDE